MRAATVLVALLSSTLGCVGEITGFSWESGPDGGAVTEPDARLSADARPPGPDAAMPGPDAGGEPGPLLGSYKLTYYYVTDEADYTGGDDTGIYDRDCTLLAMVPSAFEHSLSIEGTGRLEDGRVVNYTGSCSCATSPCYHVVDDAHPWGSGSGNRPLLPFRSVAVDNDVLDIGKQYYVEELDGVLMPGDDIGMFVHDGCVSADDTGGGIDGEHIDFFVALKAHYLTLDRELRLDDVMLHEGGTKCR